MTAEPTFKLSVSVSHNHLRIAIDELLHLSVPSDDIRGVHAYKSGGYFYIEYHVADSTIECTYKTEEIWVAILKELEKVKVI